MTKVRFCRPASRNSRGQARRSRFIRPPTRLQEKEHSDRRRFTGPRLSALRQRRCGDRRTSPAFVTYRVATHVSVPALGRERDILREVKVRTRDDSAVIVDLPGGGTQLGRGFPITPSFDALSYFVLHWKIGIHQDVTSYVSDVQPLHYDDSSGEYRRRRRLSAASIQGVLRERFERRSGWENPRYARAVRLRQKASGKAGQHLLSRGTLHRQRLGSACRGDLQRRRRHSLYDRLRHVQGHWLVRHVHYEETLHGPLHIGRLHFSADAVYDGFAFPAVCARSAARLMRAAVYAGTGGPEVIALRELPDPVCGSDDALVEVAFAGLNRADILDRMGVYGGGKRANEVVPGLEFSGTVREVGAHVTNVRAGSARFAAWLPGGAHAELLVAQAQTLAVLPDGRQPRSRVRRFPRRS